VRRSIVISLLAGILCTVLAAGASAQAATDQESQLDSDSTTLSNEGSSDTGAAAVAQTIETMFGVTADQVTALRADNLGYGEIVILLSLAQTMTGGLTTDNINSVLAIRQGPPVVGWGKIARDMGLNLGTLVSGVVKVAERSQAILKAQSASGNGKGNGNSGGASSGAGAAGSNAGSGYRR